jgi:GDPmannose 4,6-dehydratase
MKKAIVVGSEGQDGRLLFDLLSRRDYGVFGVGRDAVRGLTEGIAAPVEVLNGANVAEAVQRVVPDEIYYLAAVHHSSQEVSGDFPRALFRDSFNVNVNGLLNFLEAMRLHAPKSRLFYAASSHVFGVPAASPQNENTPLAPRCVYGITKTAGVRCCGFYRENYGIFAACGILYNHESSYRRAEFVTSKIVRSAVRIKHGQSEKLTLGDLSAKVDWGYAPDYVHAMTRILSLEKPEDFVIASGEAHSVREFVEIAFEAAGLDWKNHVTEDASMIGKSRLGLVGDSSKLRRMTGWSPTVNFKEMVRLLVEEAIKAPAH